MESQNSNLTHSSKRPNKDTLKKEYINQIQNQANSDYTTIDEQIFIVEEMLRSEIGTFILENKGANGFWTDILINCINEGYTREKSKENFFEEFLLFRSPVVIAHRERFKLFQDTIQKTLKPGLSLASIPCGLMRDLLSLDYSNSHPCKLTGIDLDAESLKLASNLAKSLGCKNQISFVQKNAWDLESSEEFDVISSSGLNVYEPSRERTVELYKVLLRALKPGGKLVTSVLTYPPFSNNQTDWDLSSIPKEDLRLEQVIHHDILGVKWGNYRSIDDLKTDFLSAGFSKAEVEMDSKKIFPTIIAYK